MRDEITTIDVLIHPVKWIGNTRYRHAMMSLPTPPHTWRFVCRDPETGGVQIVACISFLENGRQRTMRQPLRKVKR